MWRISTVTEFAASALGLVVIDAASGWYVHTIPEALVLALTWFSLRRR